MFVSRSTSLTAFFLDVLRMVLGNAKWILDLAYYVLDDVFDLADEFESVFSDQEAFAQKGEIEGVLVAWYLLK